MLRRLVPLLAASAIAFAVLAVPMRTHAIAVEFPYFGGLMGGVPLLPCTGFTQISFQTLVPETKEQQAARQKLIDAGTAAPQPTATTTFTAVDGNAISYVDSQGVRQTLPQCTSICDLFGLANNLLIFTLSILITVILPIMIMVGAGYIIISGGNPGQRATGIKIIQSTLVGVLICVFGFFLVNQMLQLIFDRVYGDALREAAKNQPGTQLTQDQIDNLFSWNNLSCSITNGLNISSSPTTQTTNPTSTTATPNSRTTNPSTSNPSTNTGTTISKTAVAAGSCAKNDSQYSCVLGFAKPAWICDQFGGATPYYCRTQAAAGQCYNAKDVQQGLDVCAGGWSSDAAGCDTSGGDQRRCLGAKTAVAPGTCVKTDSLFSCALGFAKPAWICDQEGTQTPYFCRTQAAAGTCYRQQSVEQGLDVCAGGWSSDAGGCDPGMRLCLPKS